MNDKNDLSFTIKPPAGCERNLCGIVLLKQPKSGAVNEQNEIRFVVYYKPYGRHIRKRTDPFHIV